MTIPSTSSPTGNKNASKLAGFDLIQTNYKTVGDHGIRADFLIPKTPFSGKKRPVIVRFHGGALITGDSLFLDWFPQWVFDLAQKHGAVIVSPNYRLLPEATSLEIFQDIEDFWSWLHSSTVTDLLLSSQSGSNSTELDLTRIITTGESAGGLLSVCLALMYPDNIRAATVSYPCIDMASYSVPTKKPMFGSVTFPESTIKEDLKLIKPGAVETEAHPPTRLPLALAAIQHGKLTEFYERGTEDDPRREVRYPLEKLDSADVKFPRGGIAIIHGRQDSVVPVEGNVKFFVKAREVMKGKPGVDKLVLAVREGDHGFDNAIGLDEGWLSDALKGAVETWLE